MESPAERRRKGTRGVPGQRRRGQPKGFSSGAAYAAGAACVRRRGLDWGGLRPLATSVPRPVPAWAYRAVDRRDAEERSWWLPCGRTAVAAAAAEAPAGRERRP
ncbi:unnamed protein product [Miscanthus lutarioriparius]|uniref:Uncharacterized protein n=1 Tax=Miscanthus lutarioriparius TaxID=422564 RepID=A0A811P095_9POAL|nr:unnamed protein product [Miscanthus lutarioriparius]